MLTSERSIIICAPTSMTLSAKELSEVMSCGCGKIWSIQNAKVPPPKTLTEP